MRTLTPVSVPLVIVAVCLAVWAGAPAWAEPPAAGSGGETAVWTPKELRFTYMGFTSHYSCDGLRDKISSTLLKFGARKDLVVNEISCGAGMGRPSPFPAVSIKMNVLTPAPDKTDPNAAAATPTVTTHWKLVDLAASRDPLDVAGDCELIEQIKQRILPLFTARDVEYKSSCVPNQLQLGSTQLKAQFLVADAPAPKAAASQ
jgi:hypothetical protein